MIAWGRWRHATQCMPACLAALHGVRTGGRWGRAAQLQPDICASGSQPSCSCTGLSKHGAYIRCTHPHGAGDGLDEVRQRIRQYGLRCVGPGVPAGVGCADRGSPTLCHSSAAWGCGGRCHRPAASLSMAARLCWCPLVSASAAHPGGAPMPCPGPSLSPPPLSHSCRLAGLWRLSCCP